MDSSVQMLVNILPEIALVASATWLFLASAFTRSETNWSATAVMAFVVAASGLLVQATQMLTPQIFAGTAPPPPGGPIALDALAFGCRCLAVLSGLLFASAAAFGGGRRLSAEFLGSLILAAVGVMLAGAAMDLVLLFLALELISIPTYVLLFLGRSDRGSAEAAAKYFFLSILSSAILLYGFSLLYGVAGTTDLTEIWAALYGTAGAISTLAVVAAVLIVAGLAFKIAAVPFHFYAPDVYQGTTNVNAGLLAVLPKIAGIVVLVRLVGVGVPGAERYGWQLALIIAVLTMSLGNLAALWQNNIRRLMAYSSIAHSGYMLIGLTVGLALAEAGTPRASGFSAMLFYLVVYVLATTGTFTALGYLGSRQREINMVDELAGLVRTHPTAAAAIGVCMFSLTGIPPLAGFWGKLTLFGSAIYGASGAADEAGSAGLIALAVIGVLNAAVGAAYYLRVVGVMFFRPTVSRPPAAGPQGALAAAVVCAALILVVGLVPGRLLNGSRGAGQAAVTTSKAYQATSEPMDQSSLMDEQISRIDRPAANEPVD